MKHLFRFAEALLILSLVACSKKASHEPKVVASSASYKPPFFSDPDRKIKFLQVLPTVERMYQQYALRNHFPAIAYGIVVDNELIFAGAAGIINIKKNISATPSSLFRIASMTKSFTAMAVLKLRDEGEMDLDDPVSKFIIEMRSLKYLTSDSPEITIRNLLTMTAGFPEDNPWGDRQLADTPEQLRTFISDGISFSNTPSKEYEYSNLGYAMLGEIVTVVSGIPYQEYISDNILTPLGMTNTKWEYTEVDPSLLALGYRWEDDTWKEEPLLHDGIYGAMGGLITSIEDFSKYVNLHVDAWPPRNGPDDGPLKRSSLREMHKPWQFRGLYANETNRDGSNCASVGGYGYGLGWRRNCDGIERVSHSGGLPGFGSEYRFYPEYGFGVICFANLTYAPAGQANSNVMDTLLTLIKLSPRILPASDTLQHRKDQIMSLLNSWGGDLENKVLAENFYLDLSRETWIKRSKELMDQIGNVTEVDPIIPENQLRGKFIVHGEKNNAEIFFTLTPENIPKIQQLDVVVIGGGAAQ